VLPVEKHADIKIVDHARKDALPGTCVTPLSLCLLIIRRSPDLIVCSYSYTYIERSIRNGVLEDLEDHAVGPPAGTVRSVGSVIHPAKTTRTKFTPEDDRILWLWVEQTPQQGGGTDGNIIYKQLEAKVMRALYSVASSIDQLFLCRTPDTHGSHGEIAGSNTSRVCPVRPSSRPTPHPRRLSIHPQRKSQTIHR